MTKIILRRRADLDDWFFVPELEECDTASLSNRFLSAKDMRGLNLQGVNMRGSRLTDTDFTGSDLSGADLRDTYMHDTILTDVNLTGADLKGARHLATAKHKNILQIRPLGESPWLIAAYVNKDEDLLAIGWQPAKTIDEWEAMTDEEMAATDSEALPFWPREKEHIIREARDKCAEFRAKGGVK